MPLSRRQLLTTGAAAGTGSLLSLAQQEAFAATGDGSRTPNAQPLADRLCIFTDHLDDDGSYSYAEVAKMMKQLGVTGPDLTLRGGGLIDPSRVTEELPKAMAAFKNEGLTIPMVSTNLNSAGDPTAKSLIAALKAAGIHYFKLGYYGYNGVENWEKRLAEVRNDLAGLLKLTGEAGLTAGLHNHAGASIGGALWDSWELMKGLDPKQVGFYFDPSHATIEGGNHGWKLNLQRVSPRIVMVALKDFVWEKSGDGWRTRWVPLGEGMVRWPEFLRMLGKVPFAGPVSLHIEYDPGGNNKADRFEKSFLAAERDLNFLRKQLKAV